MTGNDTKLSVEKRTLLHLLKYSKAYAEAWEVPHAMSQEGISEALDILLNNVSRAMKSLKGEGKVEERLAHIKGVKRRRRAYFLTQEGTTTAEGLRKEVLSQIVPFVGKDGVPTDITVEKVVSSFKLDFGHSVSAAEVLESVRRNGVFDSSKVRSQTEAQEKGVAVSKARAYVDLTDSAPRLVEFVGREGIVARIGQCIDGPGPPIIVVHGMAGIGKTSVALRVIEALRGQRHVFYYRFHRWDSIQNLTSALQELLKRMGSRSQQTSDLMGMDVNELALFLVRELGSRPVLVVLDDFQKAKDDIVPLFRLLTDLSTQFKGLRVLLACRTVPGFYSRRDVTVNKVVEEIHLDALDKDETRALLGDDYGEEALERMFKLSRGVPLFLEILSSVENVDAIGDVQRYVEEEIYSELAPGERKVLENLSVHRYPVPSQAILVGGTSFDDLSALCRKSLVMELPHRRFEAHDMIRDFVFQRLSPDQRRGCHEKAAQFYQACVEGRDPVNDMYFSPELASLEAVHHMQQSGNMQGGADLLLKIGPDLLTHGYSEVSDLLMSFERSDVDKATWADILLQRGDAAVTEEDWSTALDLYHEALEEKRALGAERSTLAAIHGMIGRVHMNVERWEDTIRSHKDALRMFEEAGDDRGIAKELINLGIVYRNKRDWRTAEASYKKARKILEALGDVTGLIVLHNNLALLKKGQGNLRDAERSVAKALDLASSAKDEIGKAMVLYTRGEIRSGTGRLDEARKDHEEAAEIFRRNKEFDPAIRIFIGLGDMLSEVGQADDAMKAYLKALDIYQFKKGRSRSLFRRRRSAEDLGTLGDIYDSLSSVFRAKGNLKEAIGFDMKALDCHEADGNRPAVARKLLDSGLAYEEMGRLEEAWTQMERALERLSDTDDLRGMAAVRLNLVRVCLARGDGKRATKHAEQVKDISERLGDKDLRSIAIEELKRARKKAPRRRPGPKKKR